MEGAAHSLFGDKLRELRKSAGLSQNDLARQVVADKSLISRWETGDRLPNADNLGRLMMVFQELGVPSADIIELQRSFLSLNVIDDHSSQVLADNPILTSMASILSHPELDQDGQQELNDQLSHLLGYYQRLILAKQLFDSRQWQQAYDAYNKLREQYEISSEKPRARPLIMQATCAYRVGQYHRAIDCYEAALAILRDDPTHASVPETHIRLGSVYRRLGDWKQAEAHYEEAQNIYVDRRDLIGVATCLRSRAGNYLFQGEAQRALKLCEQALDVFRKYGHAEGEASTMQHLGWALSLSGDTERAIEYQANALDKARQLGAIDVEIVKAERYYADAYLAHADLLDELTRKPAVQIAERLYADALDMIGKLPGSEQEKGKLLRGEVLFGLGRVAARRREWTKARDLLERSERIHRELGEQMRLGLVLQEQGRLFVLTENSRLAEERFREAERVFSRMLNLYHLANVIADHANMRSRIPKREDQALEDVHRGLSIIEGHDYPLPKAWLHAAAAKSWASKREISSAANSFANAIRISQTYSHLLVERILDELERTETEVANMGDVDLSRDLARMVGENLMTTGFPTKEYHRLAWQEPSQGSVHHVPTQV